MTKLLFSDAHTHTNPVRGLGVRSIVPKFKEVNGWFMALVSLAPWHYGLDPTYEHYLVSARIIIKECKTAKELGIKCKCFAGVHPADIDKLIDKYNYRLDEAYNLLDRVLDALIDMCKEGLIDGIGEVGRQHYKTSPERIAVSEMLLMKALDAAKDYDFIVHLHMENGGIVTANYIHRICKMIGLKDRRKIILHHVTDPTLLEEAIHLGFSTTVPGTFSVLTKLDMIPPVFMVESDHLDDPRRPGVVIYPWVMVEHELELLNQKIVSREYLERINIDNIIETYGVYP